MSEKHFGEKRSSSIGMYIRSTSDIPPNWNDMRTNFGYERVIRNHRGRAFGDKKDIRECNLIKTPERLEVKRCQKFSLERLLFPETK